MSGFRLVNLSMLLGKNSATSTRVFAPDHWTGFWNKRDSVPYLQIDKSNKGGLQ